MGTPQTKKPFEPLFIDARFRFDQPSETLQQIKRTLSSGISVVMTRIDIAGGIKVNGFEVLVCSLSIGGEYLEQMREAHGEFLSEMTGENVMELGMNHRVSERITEALVAGCDVYLIPDQTCEGSGVLGKYTLCRLAF